MTAAGERSPDDGDALHVLLHFGGGRIIVVRDGFLELVGGGELRVEHAEVQRDRQLENIIQLVQVGSLEDGAEVEVGPGSLDPNVDVLPNLGRVYRVRESINGRQLGSRMPDAGHKEIQIGNRVVIPSDNLRAGNRRTLKTVLGVSVLNVSNNPHKKILLWGGLELHYITVYRKSQKNLKGNKQNN